MELLTQTSTDHIYITCCHVWGCLVFVLDEKLQDGKKIPKCNCHLQLGKFWVFQVRFLPQSQISKTLLLVKYLPNITLCLMIFQTVWWTGEDEAVTDVIFNQLFEHNQYFYVEKDFGQDGEFIYSPSPLYVVWLGKPKLFSWQKKLARQKQINEDRWHSNWINKLPEHLCHLSHMVIIIRLTFQSQYQEDTGSRRNYRLK